MKFLLSFLLFIVFFENSVHAQVKVEESGYGTTGNSWPAVVVYFEGQSLNDKALVLACAHCIDLNGGEVHLFGTTKDYSSSSSDTEIFLKKGVKNWSKPDLNEIHVTSYEIAILRLKISYLELQNIYGIKRRLISKERPIEGSPIFFVTDPRRDMLNQACEISEYHDGITIPYQRPNISSLIVIHFKKSILYFDCVSKNGLSGSIIVDAKSDAVYGANSGGTFPNRTYKNEIISFTTSLHHLYDCINPDFSLNLNLSGCELPK